MDDDLIISKIRNFAQENSEQDDIHGFLHIERVYNNCIQMGSELNANMLVLRISALLHDIGRIQERMDSPGKSHAELSAEMTRKYLNSSSFNFPLEVINDIVHCILAHSFSNNLIPQTLEAKILSDADKLDAIGAVGLYRTIGFTVKNYGGIDTVIEHLENKILKLKDQMFLDSSKRMAEKRHQIILDFYKQIKNEK